MPSFCNPSLSSLMAEALLGTCSRLRGVEFVFVGSCGQEPNWFARPLPSRVSDDCMREFVAALACVRREFDLQLET